jgi:hypothetical protein
VAGSFEHGDEYSGLIIRWEIFEYLSEWWLLQKDSALWSQLGTWGLSLVSEVKYTMTYRPIARQRLGKHIPAESCTCNNRTFIARKEAL